MKPVLPEGIGKSVDGNDLEAGIGNGSGQYGIGNILAQRKRSGLCGEINNSFNALNGVEYALYASLALDAHHAFNDHGLFHENTHSFFQMAA